MSFNAALLFRTGNDSFTCHRSVDLACFTSLTPNSPETLSATIVKKLQIRGLFFGDGSINPIVGLTQNSPRRIWTCDLLTSTPSDSQYNRRLETLTHSNLKNTLEDLPYWLVGLDSFALMPKIRFPPSDRFPHRGFTSSLQKTVQFRHPTARVPRQHPILALNRPRVVSVLPIPHVNKDSLLAI